ncbi:MAG: AAA family ATPase, partial [Pseudoflavonifractor sp.]|nr:AAA family ATPase [Pseudoflavonifractor sp.]
MAKEKSVFYCTDCGNEVLRWQGQCPACGAWNTIVERPAAPKSKTPKSTSGRRDAGTMSFARPRCITEVETTDELRFDTGMNELDRVLGGGAVKGSLVLVGGAPGIGKSTLMLQICDSLCRFADVLYVSGEESERQIKMRAVRQLRGEDGPDAGLPDHLMLVTETNLEIILEHVEALHPGILVIDSIQTIYLPDLQSSAG